MEKQENCLCCYYRWHLSRKNSHEIFDSGMTNFNVSDFFIIAILGFPIADRYRKNIHKPAMVFDGSLWNLNTIRFNRQMFHILGTKIYIFSFFFHMIERRENRFRNIRSNDDILKHSQN